VNRRLTVPLIARDHIRGAFDAPLILVQYGDFECRACAEAYRVVKAIRNQMPLQIAYAFRHFPLTLVHVNAEYLAMAAEAAGNQGRFWEMHDFIFDSSRLPGESQVLKQADKMGIDAIHLERDIAERRNIGRIAEDFESGLRSGVNGTPTFYINGNRHDGTLDLASLMAALERAAATSGSYPIKTGPETNNKQALLEA